MTRLLFVCLGNICRSPIVESVARVEFARAGLDIEVASAGTGAWHAGEPADPRAIAAAEASGYPLAAHRARQVAAGDFDAFDEVLAMDRANLRALQHWRPAPARSAAALFLGDAEVPDPYYGTRADFARVVALARDGVRTLARRLGAPTAAR